MVASVLIIIIPTAHSTTEPILITERTEYGISSNYLYLTFTDMIGKDQYITNITLEFADSGKTRTIEVTDFLLYQEYQVDVYGYKNISHGKYKDEINESVNYSCWNPETQTNETCQRHEMKYYDDKGTLCDYVLGDKTCLKTVWGVIDQESKYDYLPTPNVKEKTTYNGLKIEQKVDGSIPLPKGGTAQVKIPMNHILFYGMVIEDWENKYNITACSQYGCALLDPTWWNSSWKKVRVITITNQSAYPLSDYQVFLNITYDSDMQADFDDLRFTSDDNSTVLGVNAEVWVKVPSINGVTKISMYYNNSDALSASSPYATMLAYDDFSTNSLANYTEASTTTFITESISGGKLSINGGTGTWGTLYYNQLTANNVSLHAIAKHNGGNNQWITTTVRTSTDRNYGYFAGFQDSSNEEFTIKWVDGAETILDNNGGQTWTNQVDWFDFVIAVSGTHLEHNLSYVNGTSLITFSTTDSGVTGANGNYFGFRVHKANMLIDEWFARNYHYPEPTYTIGSEELPDSTPPAITIQSPTNTTYPTSNIWFNVSLNEAGDTCLVDYGNGNVSMTNSTGNWNHNNATVDDGTYNAIFFCNDTAGNGNETNIYFTVDTTPPTISNIAWETTGGFTDATLSFNQIIDYINATSSETPNNINLTVYDPDGIKVITESPMSQVGSTNVYQYTTDFTLNKAGTWVLQVKVSDILNNMNITNATFSVSTVALNLTMGWYGYSGKKILNSSEISDFANYDYILYEMEENISNLSSSWNDMLDAVNNSYIQGIRVGINYILDCNINLSSCSNNAKNNITLNFPDLTNAPYSATVEYVSIEIKDVDNYNTTQKDSVMNDIAKNITDATSNKFVIFSKNYNSTGFDSSYIQYTTMIYVDSQTESSWIEKEKYLMRNNASINRIYENVPDAVKTAAKNYYNNIMKILRSAPNVTAQLSQSDVGVLNNGDIIVFNNLSSPVTAEINISEVSQDSGKDAWDTTNKYLIESNTDLNFSVNVSSYSATMLFFEDLDHIEMSTTSDATVYKGDGTSTKYFNYTDGTRDGNHGLYGANDIMIELFDPHYLKNNFITYYGWINSSYISSSEMCDYEILILADKNNAELDNLVSTCTSTEIYMYISVGDYDQNNQQNWYDNKTSEVDTILNLNGSLHIFIDGLDYGIGGNNFSSRMKDLVDYVQVTKGRKAILNTYTAYEEFATWGKGGVMKESCVNRWNGNNPSSPDSYTRESWSLELNKSRWYQSHNVKVLCQSFSNRTTDGTNIILNYTEMEDIYFASKVLGYDYFYLSQPDFNYAFFEYLYDTGADVSNSYVTDDSETYYRRYENGIVYYNSSTGNGWIDDGRIINDATVCFDLYDAYPTSVSFKFTVNNPQPTGDSGDYVISDGWGVYSWSWQCVSLTTPPVNGRYLIEGWVSPRTTIIGQGLNIGYADVSGGSKHSYFDASTTDSFTPYTYGRNWQINISVNETKKTSIDTTTHITQTNVSHLNKINVTLSSEKSFDIEVWSLPITVSDIDSLSYWNGSSFITLNWSNVSNCDSSNPTWNETNINGEVHKACIKEKGDGNYYVRFGSPSLSTRTYQITTDSTPPSITFVSQYPADISSTNMFTSDLNVSYNMTDTSGINESSVKFYYKTNSSTSDISQFINGTSVSGWQIKEGTNVSSLWNFSLDHMNIYPATYNIDENVMETEQKHHYSLDAKNKIIKTRFLNTSKISEHNYFVVDAQNQTGTTEFMRIYYCNETYTAGNPETSENCVEIFNLMPASPYNFSEGGSKYWIVPMAINTTSGMIGDVYVTNTSYILLRDSASPGGWNISYITNVSRTDTIQVSSNNGIAYTNFSGTIDGHIHQFDGTSLWYYACANDTYENNGCSAVRQDLLELGNLPPNSPDVYSPTEGTYSGNITINYTESLSPNGYPITHYNISLVNMTLGFVQEIQGNNSVNLSYVWDSTSATDGEYFIRVESCDNQSQCSYGYSENITIDNTYPTISLISPINATYLSSTISVKYTAIDEHLDSCWYSLSGSNTTISSCNNFTLTSLSDGSYKLIISANDTLGHTNSSTVYFTISIAPAVTRPAAVGGGGVVVKSYMETEDITVKIPLGQCIIKESLVFSNFGSWVHVRPLVDNAKVSIWNINRWENESDIFLNYGNNTLKFKICSTNSGNESGLIELKQTFNMVTLNKTVDAIQHIKLNLDITENKTMQVNEEIPTKITGNMISEILKNPSMMIVALVVICALIYAFLWLKDNWDKEIEW
ncbi:MAG: DUF2341 domain-containing protein [Candidatus Helarchaeota archaeon]